MGRHVRESTGEYTAADEEATTGTNGEQLDSLKTYSQR